MSSDRQVLSVSQLNRAAKDLLETYLPALWVEGELSNLALPSSGHWYFSLKDSAAQVRCAMFKNRNLMVRFKPAAGQKVLVRARVSLYEGRGDYQLLVDHMEPAGLGDLQRQFEALKAQLQAEGLFDASHKKPLPAWPQRLGLVTSATGAAVRDILQVLRRRFPALPVLVLPVAVQGADAARQIADAIRLANRHQLCDLLIVGRGGGSLEDLWAFNEEMVARAVFDSAIPVVSAVGHEVDFTIIDFVADLRAPTPSAAAELVSPDGLALLDGIDRQSRRLQRALQQQLQAHRRQLQHLRQRLRHPGQKLMAQAQRLDQLEVRLRRAWQQRAGQARHQLATLAQRLHRNPARQRLQQQRERCRALETRLVRAQRQHLQQQRQRLAHSAELLHGISPLNTLNRGYAIVFNTDGQALRSARQVAVGDRLRARLSQGQVECEVIRTESE